MQLEGFKEDLITSFQEKAGDLMQMLSQDEWALVERQLVRYAELELMALAAKYDNTIDIAQINLDIDQVYASLSAIGEIAMGKAKQAMREAVWDMIKVVIRTVIGALL